MSRRGGLPGSPLDLVSQRILQPELPTFDSSDAKSENWNAYSHGLPLFSSTSSCVRLSKEKYGKVYRIVCTKLTRRLASSANALGGIVALLWTAKIGRASCREKG